MNSNNGSSSASNDRKMRSGFSDEKNDTRGTVVASNSKRLDSEARIDSKEFVATSVGRVEHAVESSAAFQFGTIQDMRVLDDRAGQFQNRFGEFGFPMAGDFNLPMAPLYPQMQAQQCGVNCPYPYSSSTPNFPPQPFRESAAQYRPAVEADNPRSVFRENLNYSNDPALKMRDLLQPMQMSNPNIYQKHERPNHPIRYQTPLSNNRGHGYGESSLVPQYPNQMPRLGGFQQHNSNLNATDPSWNFQTPSFSQQNPNSRDMFFGLPHIPAQFTSQNIPLPPQNIPPPPRFTTEEKPVLSNTRQNQTATSASRLRQPESYPPPGQPLTKDQAAYAVANKNIAYYMSVTGTPLVGSHTKQTIMARAWRAKLKKLEERVAFNSFVTWAKRWLNYHGGVPIFARKRKQSEEQSNQHDKAPVLSLEKPPAKSPTRSEGSDLGIDKDAIGMPQYYPSQPSQPSQKAPEFQQECQGASAYFPSLSEEIQTPSQDHNPRPDPKSEWEAHNNWVPPNNNMGPTSEWEADSNWVTPNNNSGPHASTCDLGVNSLGGIGQSPVQEYSHLYPNPHLPVTSNAPNFPSNLRSLHLPVLSNTPNVPSSPRFPQQPIQSSFPYVPPALESPQLPALPSTPNVPSKPRFPQQPIQSSFPYVPPVLESPQLPALPSTPDTSVDLRFPQLPTTSSSVNAPSDHISPRLPVLPSAPQASSDLRFPELPKIPSPCIIPQDLKSPRVQVLPSTSSAPSDLRTPRATNSSDLGKNGGTSKQASLELVTPQQLIGSGAGIATSSANAEAGTRLVQAPSPPQPAMETQADSELERMKSRAKSARADEPILTFFLHKTGQEGRDKITSFGNLTESRKHASDWLMAQSVIVGNEFLSFAKANDSEAGRVQRREFVLAFVRAEQQRRDELAKADSTNHEGDENSKDSNSNSDIAEDEEDEETIDDLLEKESDENGEFWNIPWYMRGSKMW